MRGARLHGTKFASLVPQALLDFDGKRLTASIRLNALNGRRQFLDHLLKELQGMGTGSAWKEC